MRLTNKIAQYREWKGGVKHCTFNPNEPGVVRIHLIPPRPRLFSNAQYIVILNGYYILPLGYSWAVMLSEFMKQVNKYDSKGICDEDEKEIIGATLSSVHKLYPFVDSEQLREDLLEMLDVIFEVASGGSTDADIEKMSIRSYAKNMYAPHRMDLMISAMTDDNGNWKCNQKCSFCYAARQELGKARELSMEDWKKAIDKLKKAGVPMITFTGGEPTLRKDLIELVEYSKWFITRLNTNGVALTEELVRGLKQASLDSVQITLYSHSDAIHNALVGCERHSQTVEGIKRAVAAGLDVSINTPLCRDNADYLKTLEFIHSLGVRFVTVSGLICTGNAKENCKDKDLLADELYEIIKAAKSFCDEHGMEIDFTSPGLIDQQLFEKLSMNVPICGAALSNMAIAPDGTVIPCQSWLESNSGLGNILTDDFGKIWSDSRCIKLRAMSEKEAIYCPFRTREEG